MRISEQLLDWLLLGKVTEKRKDYLCWIFLFILSALVVALLSLARTLVTFGEFADSVRYYDAARNIFEGRIFSFFPHHPKFAYGLPGYPLFAAFTAVINGSLDPNFTVQMQIFLHPIIIIFTFLSARLFCSRWCSLLAATMMATLPSLLFNDLLFLSETLSIAIFSISLFILLKAFKSGRAWHFALAGLAFGCLLYVKQVYELPIAITALAILFILKMTFWQRLLRAFLLVFVMLLAVTPWIIRNQQIFGTFSLQLLYEYGNVLATSNVPWEVYDSQYEQEVRPKINKLIAEGKYAQAELLDNKMQQDIALNYILADPWRTSKAFWEKLLLILRPYAGSSLSYLPFPQNMMWFSYYCLLFIGILISFVLRPPSPYLLINLIFIVSMCIFSTTIHTNIRFRLGYELPMVLLAAYGWTRALRRSREVKPKASS
jgi:ABC-type multidrug transport system fused ATPase/permease subunit